MILVNTDYITGKEFEMMGLVKGSTIQSKNVGRDITQGLKTLVGGELKSSTEAVVGNQAIRTIQEYHFTKGFFGTNGVTRRSGCTTPDVNEAVIKKTAMEQCRQCYVLCDASKFNSISSVTFADFEKPIFITDRKVPGYEKSKHIIVCETERK